jgi:hypothetical protein
LNSVIPRSFLQWALHRLMSGTPSGIGSGGMISSLTTQINRTTRHGGDEQAVKTARAPAGPATVETAAAEQQQDDDDQQNEPHGFRAPAACKDKVARQDNAGPPKSIRNESKRDKPSGMSHSRGDSEGLWIRKSRR